MRDPMEILSSQLEDDLRESRSAAKISTSDNYAAQENAVTSTAKKESREELVMRLLKERRDKQQSQQSMAQQMQQDEAKMNSGAHSQY